MDILRIVITAIVMGGVYLAMARQGHLHNKTPLQRALLVFPVFFALLLIISLLWPG